MKVTLMWVVSGFMVAVFFALFGMYIIDVESVALFSIFSFSVIGLFLLILFAIVSEKVFRDGSPLEDISVGEYDVAFVHRAGTYIFIGVTRGKEKVQFFRFLKIDLENAFKRDSEKLIVTERVSFWGEKIKILQLQ